MESVERVRTIISEILEIEPEEMTETSLFIDDHDADSLRAVEILAKLEKELAIEIPQSELAKMINLTEVLKVLRNHGWDG